MPYSYLACYDSGLDWSHAYSLKEGQVLTVITYVLTSSPVRASGCVFDPSLGCMDF